MKTSKIRIHPSRENVEAIDKLPFYSDSPWYIYKVLEWAEEYDGSLDINVKRDFTENQVELIIQDLIDNGIKNITRILYQEYK